MMTDLDVQAVIGLEVHAQLSTRSKMFCRCSARYFESEPNSHVCAVCGGMPGSLPVTNARAVQCTLMAALALNCDVQPYSKFDRKNYSYADLPKGYQISQYDSPIGRGGWMEYWEGGELQRCGIVRVHLEEDTGKIIHTSVDGREVSLVDYNRSGVPLMEIVSEPDLHSPTQAREYFASLRQVLMYLGISDGNLQEGSMRADVNVSVRRPREALGTKVEVKNLNSFRAVQRALEFEITRQTGLLARGEPVVHETRGWHEGREETIAQRTKEYAHDYRYFPEPDLPPLHFSRQELQVIKGSLPEMPVDRRARFMRSHAIPESAAAILTSDRALADFFEATISDGGVVPSTAAKWITGELLRLLNDAALSIQDALIRPEDFASLLTMVEKGAVSGTAAKLVLEEMFRSGNGAEDVVSRLGLERIADEASLGALVDEVLEDNPSMVEQYMQGKTQVFQALVGQAMKLSRGKADPAVLRDILRARLDDTR